MQLTGTPPALVFAASDLASFVGCRHRTALDLGVALGELSKPPYDPSAQEFVERGLEHEAQYVASLVSAGLTVVDVRDAPNRAAATLDALTRGVDIVVQGMLAGDGWIGYPDILRRVEVPSALGPWSYEVYDTKLSRETRGSTILQLSVYSELLARVQGLAPERFHVITPDPVNGNHAFRVDHYAAYYRLVKQLLAQWVGPALRAGRQPHDALSWESLADAHYPEPVEQCDYCRWSDRCDGASAGPRASTRWRQPAGRGA